MITIETTEGVFLPLAEYNALQVKLTEAERRNKVALEAMKEASSCAYNEAPAYITGPILEKAITELELK